MRKPAILLSSLHLRKLLRRCISTQSNSLLLQSPPPPPPCRPLPIYTSAISNARFLSPCPFLLRLFSYSSCATNENPNDKAVKEEEEKNTAGLLSSELLKNSDAEPLPLPQRLDLSFSHITITPTLLLTTLNISPDAGRMALDFLKRVESRPGFQRSDEVYSYFVHYLGRRKDFKAIHEILVHGRGVGGDRCLEALVDRLVRAGRPTQAVSLFQKIGEDYGFVRNMDSLKLIVTSLCKRGYANYVEKRVKSLANEFFPDEYICDTLIEGEIR